MVNNLHLTILSFILSINLIFGQIPKNDLILLDLKKVNQEYIVNNPRLLNKFNLENYNNQPSFFNAHTIYFTAKTEGENQTDIYGIDLLRKKYWQVTNTPDGEYSPTLMPTQRFFSTIVQEEITNTQRLWEFPIDQSNGGRDLFPGITGVGYHCWLDKENVAMFIVGNPNQLILANRTTQEAKNIIDNIGRGLKKNKLGLLYFVHKSSDDNWIIKKYDPSNNSISSIVKTPGKTEDFELLSDETIIMAVGTDLFSFNPDYSTEWKKIASLAEYKIGDITRLAIFGQKLVVVTNK